MYDCFICKQNKADICSKCTNSDLKLVFNEKEYIQESVNRLRKHLQKRLLAKKLLLKYKISEKRSQINQKYELHQAKKQKIIEQKQKIELWQKDLEQEINSLFEKKQELEQKYNESVDFYCKKDDQNIKMSSSIQYQVSLIKKFQILKAKKLFDLHKDYLGYSLGEKEFKIQKVNLLKNQNEFVFIDRQNSAIRSGGEIQQIQGTFEAMNLDEDLFITATGQGVMQESINLIQNYIDFGASQNKLTEMGFQNFLDPQEYKHIPHQGRERANTMEEFDKFEGEKSTDPPKDQIQNNQNNDKQKLKEAKTIREEYASFITLNNSDYDSLSSYSEMIQRQKSIDRFEKIQGNIHAQCLLIKGIAKYLSSPLPYPLKLISQGFVIKDSSRKCYPLYLRTDPDKLIDTRHQIQFENGIILLDKNIQFLLYINGYKLTVGSCLKQILNINPLFDQKYIGRCFIIENKLLPPKKKRINEVGDEETESEYELDQFEVLKLQNRQQSANEQLESLRTSEINANGFVTNIDNDLDPHKKYESNSHDNWSDDDQYRELLDNVRRLDLSNLIHQDYIEGQQ